MTYTVLSLAYGAFLQLPTTHAPAVNSFLFKDTMALLIIVYSAKRHRDLTCDGGVPNLLNKIRQDATAYFLVLSTGHLIFLFFQIFAPVSDHCVGLRSAAHDKLHIAFDQTGSCAVSRRPSYRRRAESDGTRSYSGR